MAADGDVDDADVAATALSSSAVVVVVDAPESEIVVIDA